MTEPDDFTRRAEQYAATVADLERRLKALYHDAARRLEVLDRQIPLADPGGELAGALHRARRIYLRSLGGSGFEEPGKKAH